MALSWCLAWIIQQSSYYQTYYSCQTDQPMVAATIMKCSEVTTYKPHLVKQPMYLMTVLTLFSALVGQCWVQDKRYGCGQATLESLFVYGKKGKMADTMHSAPLRILQCRIYIGHHINTRPPMRAGWWNCFSGKNVQLYSSTRLLYSIATLSVFFQNWVDLHLRTPVRLVIIWIKFSS